MYLQRSHNDKQGKVNALFKNNCTDSRAVLITITMHYADYEVLMSVGICYVSVCMYLNVLQIVCRFNPVRFCIIFLEYKTDAHVHTTRISGYI